MTGAVKLNTAGGGSVVVQPASSIASDVTVNVPSQNCTLGIQGPAFSAYQSSAQSVSNNIITKIQFQAEEWDTAGCFDNTTNYRFTPNVPGYYQVNGAATVTAVGSYFCLAEIYKNGSAYKYGNLTNANASGYPTTNVSAQVYLNGTTDYIELYVFQFSGSAQNLAGNTQSTYFQASMVRAA